MPYQPEGQSSHLEQAWNYIAKHPGVEWLEFRKVFGRWLCSEVFVAEMEANGYLLSIDGKQFWTFKKIGRKGYTELKHSIGRKEKHNTHHYTRADLEEACRRFAAEHYGNMPTLREAVEELHNMGIQTPDNSRRNADVFWMGDRTMDEIAKAIGAIVISDEARYQARKAVVGLREFITKQKGIG